MIRYSENKDVFPKNSPKKIKKFFRGIVLKDSLFAGIPERFKERCGK